MKEKLFCKICGKELQGSQRLYCSNSCKQKGHYEDCLEAGLQAALRLM